METFAPGDRVIAINPDMSGPICGPANPELHPFLFPDGPLRRDVIYHVASVTISKECDQGLHLTGTRVFWGPHEIPWNSSRFRKAQEAGHPPVADRSKAMGAERYGIVVSSKAERLKPHAIDVRVKTDPLNWFLNPCHDVRSSCYLEDVATEFDARGLELDWACVVWDGDFR